VLAQIPCQLQNKGSTRRFVTVDGRQNQDDILTLPQNQIFQRPILNGPAASVVPHELVLRPESNRIYTKLVKSSYQLPQRVVKTIFRILCFLGVSMHKLLGSHSWRCATTTNDHSKPTAQ
jgi:hypothetical protein